MNKNKNTRMDTLNNAGIDTGRFFNINLPEGLQPGATISVVINENGQPVIVPNEQPVSYDAVATQIIEDGYVRNTKLFRRWVLAQMWQMLTYKSYARYGQDGYHGYLNERMDYNYTIKMMLEEVRVLGKLEERDKECFEERSKFFTKDVVMNVLWDYFDKVQKYVDKLPRKNCKGIPYVTIKGAHYFVADLHKKVFEPLRLRISAVSFVPGHKEQTYTEMYNKMKQVVRNMIKLPWNTPKSKDWIEAYKGNGAYYSCKNLIMYHNCRVNDVEYNNGLKSNVSYTRDYSMHVLKGKLYEYQGEGWRMFAFMKKLIQDNNFDFAKAIGKKTDLYW